VHFFTIWEGQISANNMKLEIWIDNFRLLSIFIYFKTEVCCCRFFFLPNQAGSVLPVRRKRRKTYFFCHKYFAVIPLPWEKLSMFTKQKTERKEERKPHADTNRNARTQVTSCVRTRERVP